MRLDKYLCDSVDVSRREAKILIRRGQVTVNDDICKDSAKQIVDNDQVAIDGELISLVGTRYIMMHKPVDTICATKDSEHYQSVISLLDIEKPELLHTVGRLDADTTGLILITDDGKWSHRIASPNQTCVKYYRAWLIEEMDEQQQAQAIQAFAQGIELKSEKQSCQPAELAFVAPNEAIVGVSEGKYHQVKRMFAAIGNKVETLHREQIGELPLDEELEPCEWRYLTEAEIALF